MDDRGLPDAVPLEHRDGLTRAVLGELHRLAGRIDEPILGRRPSRPPGGWGRRGRWRAHRGGGPASGSGPARRRGPRRAPRAIRAWSITNRTAIGIAIWARRIRSSNGSSEMFPGEKIHDAVAAGSRAAPTRTGVIWRRTGPLDRSQRRRTTMTGAPSRTRSGPAGSCRSTWAALSLGAMPSAFRPLSSTQEQEPEELERNGHEQEDADDGEVGSRGEATGRERQQEQRERGRPEVGQPDAAVNTTGLGTSVIVRPSSHSIPTSDHQRPEAVGRATSPEEACRTRRTTSRRAPAARSRAPIGPCCAVPTSIPRPSAPAVIKSTARTRLTVGRSRSRSLQGRSRD